MESRAHLKWWLGLAVVMVVVLFTAVYFKINPSLLVDELLVSAAMEDTITGYLEYEEEAGQKLKQGDELGRIFAAYEVIGREQVGEEQVLYLWTLQTNILQQDGQLRVISAQSGPMAVTLTGSKLSWQVSSSRRPSSENYHQDLEEIFPPEIYAVVKDHPSDDLLGRLEDRVRARARAYYEITDSELFAVTYDPPLPPELSTAGVLAPAQDKLAFIYPDEWETVSDIYVAAIPSGTAVTGDPLLMDAEWRKLSLNQWVRQDMFELAPGHLNDVYTPKELLWANESELIVIIGYAYGTVSPGGDVVRVNIDTGESQIVYAVENNRQQVTAIKIQEGRLLLTITEFDDNMMNPLDHQIELTL